MTRNLIVTLNSGTSSLRFGEEANRNGPHNLSAGAGRVATMAIPTDEEIVLARHADGLLRSGQADTG